MEIRHPMRALRDAQMESEILFPSPTARHASVNSCSSSVSDVNDLQLLLMPNPASSVLHVLTDEEIVSAEVISLHGERVLSAREKKIDVSQLSSGCYLVMVTSAQNKIWRGKVIKY
jgi:hypothetical protein